VTEQQLRSMTLDGGAFALLLGVGQFQLDRDTILDATTMHDVGRNGCFTRDRDVCRGCDRSMIGVKIQRGWADHERRLKTGNRFS